MALAKSLSETRLEKDRGTGVEVRKHLEGGTIGGLSYLYHHISAALTPSSSVSFQALTFGLEGLEVHFGEPVEIQATPFHVCKVILQGDKKCLQVSNNPVVSWDDVRRGSWAWVIIIVPPKGNAHAVSATSEADCCADLESGAEAWRRL